MNKKLLKYILVILLIIIIGFGLLFTTYILKHREYNNRVSKIAHTDIFLGEKIMNLESVEFKICDSLYFYSRKQLNDTICENLGISNRKLPCETSIKYIFNDGTNKKIKAKSFNCAGCSGTNTYILNKGSIQYKYFP